MQILYSKPLKIIINIYHNIICLVENVTMIVNFISLAFYIFGIVL